MELHPILERDIHPKADLWYVLSGAGDSPAMRVGHTCTYMSNLDSNGKLYFIGGASPSGAFAEVYVFDLDAHVWDFIECSGLKARYEHSAFVPASHPGKIYLFGGADQFGSFNDIQVFDTADDSCRSVVCDGVPPSPRTFHNGACVGDRLIVYSGGETGVNPVGDRQVHVFDALSNAWSTIHTTGNPPKPRLGHLMIAVGDKVFLHGGMAGMSFYDDLHVLDLTKNSWAAVRQKKDRPPPRTGHGGFTSGSDICIFGGMNHNGALDDMYRFDTVAMSWSTVAIEGSTPSNRLDFASCVIHLKVPGPKTTTTTTTSDDGKCCSTKKPNNSDIKEQEHDDDPDHPGSSTGVDIGESEENLVEVSSLLPDCRPPDGSGLCGPLAECSLETASRSKDETPQTTVVMGLVHGGTDTEGEIFDDAFVILLKTKQ